MSGMGTINEKWKALSGQQKGMALVAGVLLGVVVIVLRKRKTTAAAADPVVAFDRSGLGPATGGGFGAGGGLDYGAPAAPSTPDTPANVVAPAPSDSLPPISDGDWLTTQPIGFAPFVASGSTTPVDPAASDGTPYGSGGYFGAGGPFGSIGYSPGVIENGGTQLVDLPGTGGQTTAFLAKMWNDATPAEKSSSAFIETFNSLLKESAKAAGTAAPQVHVLDSPVPVATSAPVPTASGPAAQPAPFQPLIVDVPGYVGWEPDTSTGQYGPPVEDTGTSVPQVNPPGTIPGNILPDAPRRASGMTSGR